MMVFAIETVGSCVWSIFCCHVFHFQTFNVSITKPKTVFNSPSSSFFAFVWVDVVWFSQTEFTNTIYLHFFCVCFASVLSDLKEDLWKEADNGRPRSESLIVYSSQLIQERVAENSIEWTIRMAWPGLARLDLDWEEQYHCFEPLVCLFLSAGFLLVALFWLIFLVFLFENVFGARALQKSKIQFKRL